jgi:hypothetical protein
MSDMTDQWTKPELWISLPVFHYSYRVSKRQHVGGGLRLTGLKQLTRRCA